MSLTALALELGKLGEELLTKGEIKPDTKVSIFAVDLLNVCMLAAQFLESHECNDKSCRVLDVGPSTVLDALTIIARSMKFEVVELKNTDLN